MGALLPCDGIEETPELTSAITGGLGVQHEHKWVFLRERLGYTDRQKKSIEERGKYRSLNMTMPPIEPIAMADVFFCEKCLKQTEVPRT